jgi:hypothetical protein
MARLPALEHPRRLRAPTVEEWARMTPAERTRLVDSLPEDEVEIYCEPEGDLHEWAVDSAKHVLRRFFRGAGRRIYLAANMGVWYPGQPSFAPDIFAVLDVDPTPPRSKWVVSAEGKGLDWVLEVVVLGDRRKDLGRNVRWYADLGIPEYFVYDRGRQQLSGYRLPGPDARSYEPIRRQSGLLPSLVLGLGLVLDEGRLRFYYAAARLEEDDELSVRLERMAEEQAQRAEEQAQRAEAEKQRAEEQAQRAEAEKQRAEAEKQRAEAEEQRAEAEKQRAEAE